MVKGIDIFQEYFNEYTDQYVLIGGAACSVSFEKQDINFGRTTKDLDIVLIVRHKQKNLENVSGNLSKTENIESGQKVMGNHSSIDLISQKMNDFLR